MSAKPLEAPFEEFLELSPYADGPSEAWEESLVYEYTEKGKKLARATANAITLLRHHPDWRGVLGFNEFRTDGVVSMQAPPWHPHAAPVHREIGVATWTDPDYVRVQDWLVRSNYSLNLGRENVAEAVRVVAMKNAFHPVKDYLLGLTWDGAPRLASWLATFCSAPATPYSSDVGTWTPSHTSSDTWLTVYLGATSQPPGYLADVGRWCLVSAVARAMRPGCKVDHLLILEGAQGEGKSEVAKILAGDWFSDTPILIGDKDGYLALAGKWIIELAELDSLSRVDMNRAKAFFTSARDCFRPPYGRSTIEAPRQCVFIGTVNHYQYLQDPSGNRRYWPVPTGKIDLDGLRAIRDQIWAEAVHLFRLGHAWWPTNEDERTRCATEQDLRVQHDVWEEPVARYLGPSRSRREGVDMTAIFLDVLGYKLERIDRAAQMRVAAILQRLGWARRRAQRDPTLLDARPDYRRWVYRYEGTEP